MNRFVLILSVLSVLALYLILYIIPLGVRPIIIPDEPRYAEIPREILSTGDWIVPRFNGLRYFEKPILGYWPIAVSIGIFGENAFAFRLPSALASGIMALIIFLLLNRFGRGYREGILAGLAFLTCIEVFAVGTTNVLDSGFSMLITAAMGSFFWASQATPARTRKMGRILGGVFTGLAFLTKGFIAFAIPAVVIIPYLFWNRRGRELLGNYWLALAAAVLVALPWGLAIYFREPDFWHFFFWEEHITRFMGAKAQHAEPFWFYISVIGWGAFPWIVLIPASIAGLVKKRIQDPLLRFSLCWFIFSFLFFSVSRGKLPTYILPCFPPLVIILIRGLDEYFHAGGKKIFKTSIWILMGVLLIIALGLLVIQTGVFPIQQIFSQLEIWKWIIAVDGIIIWVLFLSLALRQKSSFKKILLFSIGPMALLFSSHFLFPDMAKKGRAPADFLAAQSGRFNSGVILVSDNYCTGALGWFSGRNDIYLLESDGEFGYGLNYPDARGRQIRFEQFRRVVNNPARKKRILLLLDTDRYLEYQQHFPRPLSVRTGDGFVLAEF